MNILMLILILFPAFLCSNMTLEINRKILIFPPLISIFYIEQNLESNITFQILVAIKSDSQGKFHPT